MWWEASFPGRKGTLFESGRFRISVVYARDYPFKPPKVKFLTKLYHPTIAANGGCHCVSDLSWSPTCSIWTILKNASAELHDINVDSCLRPDVAKDCIDDPIGFRSKVREYTRMYATVDDLPIDQIISIMDWTNSQPASAGAPDGAAAGV